MADILLQATNEIVGYTPECTQEEVCAAAFATRA